MYVFFQLAYQTFRECLRQPVFLVLQLTALFFIGIHPIISLFVFREQQKLVTDGSLATIFVFGWITAVTCASNSVYREIATGTVLLILSKPVNRPVFIVSKMAGISFVLILFIWTTGIATLLAVHIAGHQFELDRTILLFYFLGVCLACIIGAMCNLFNHASFSATSSIALAVIFTLIGMIVYGLPQAYNGDNYVERHSGYAGNLIAAITLLVPAILMLGGLSTALSVYLNPMANMLVSGTIFFIGLISDYLYDKVIHMTLNDMTQLMHLWPGFLIPPLVILWYLTLRAVHRRFQKQTKYNIVYALTLLSLLGLFAHKKLTQAELNPPAPIINLFANVLYAIKNSAAEISHVVIPNWQLFWMADALVDQKTIPLAYVIYGFVYTFCFMIVFSCLAFLLLSAPRSRQANAPMI